MAATTTKLAAALLLALTSNATLLCLLLTERNSETFSSTPTTTTTISSSSNNDNEDGVLPSRVPRSRLSSELLRTGSAEGDGEKVSDSSKRVQDDFSSRDLDRKNVERKGGTSTSASSWQGGGGGGEIQRVKRSEDRELPRIDTGHHLEDIIATLTESELEELDPSTAEILIPALVGLESLVLRELERLHDVSVHQELRLERLEKTQLQEQEIMEAANIIREEQYLLQRKQQEEALQQQRQQQQQSKNTQDAATPSPSEDATVTATITASTTIVDFDESEGSGSGDESLAAVGAGVPPTTSTAVNYTDSPDSAIINHIYEIYSSLTSMEHKVMELGSSLTVVSSELYRQRSTLVSVEDKVEELRRNQRALVMRTTMHGFKLTDLEQFKGQAELLMRTAANAIEQFEAKMEIFKDRVTEQQDEVQLMRNVFSRLEQSNSELRTADAYKAHDIQELKRGAQQMETRLSNLYHSLDRYVGNVRWDVKTYLDHLCASNDLQC